MRGGWKGWIFASFPQPHGYYGGCYFYIYCRLGHGDIEEEGQAAPLRVETLTMLGIHVVSVSCGAEHTIALCQEGVSQDQ